MVLSTETKLPISHRYIWLVPLMHIPQGKFRLIKKKKDYLRTLLSFFMYMTIIHSLENGLVYYIPRCNGYSI